MLTKARTAVNEMWKVANKIDDSGIGKLIPTVIPGSDLRHTMKKELLFVMFKVSGYDVVPNDKQIEFLQYVIHAPINYKNKEEYVKSFERFDDDEFNPLMPAFVVIDKVFKLNISSTYLEFVDEITKLYLSIGEGLELGAIMRYYSLLKRDQILIEKGLGTKLDFDPISFVKDEKVRGMVLALCNAYDVIISNDEKMNKFLADFKALDGKSENDGPADENQDGSVAPDELTNFKDILCLLNNISSNEDIKDNSDEHGDGRTNNNVTSDEEDEENLIKNSIDKDNLVEDKLNKDNIDKDSQDKNNPTSPNKDDPDKTGNSILDQLLNKSKDRYSSNSDNLKITTFDKEKQEDNNSGDELDRLIGLKEVKQQVRSMYNVVKIREECKNRGIKRDPMSYHMVFVGNPGTGKTTVARLMAEKFHDMGLLSKGHLVEATRADLVAGYVGQTAIKVKSVIDKAKGGVLFIDEAYALSRDKGEFGDEAISMLLKEMEDERADMIVIVAGYPDLISEFLESNPGLKSRFSKTIHFPDYSGEELTQIFVKFCQDNNIIKNSMVIEEVRKHFMNEVSRKKRNFGNAREVRNYFEEALMNQANRLMEKETLTDRMLRNLVVADLPKKVIIDSKVYFQ